MRPQISTASYVTAYKTNPQALNRREKTQEEQWSIVPVYHAGEVNFQSCFKAFGRGVTVTTATCGARARASLDSDWRMKFEKPAKCCQKAKTRYGAFEK